MGTTYYAICDTCLAYTRVGRYWDWKSDPSNLEADTPGWTAGWIYKAVILHKFLDRHCGHMVGLWPEFTWVNSDGEGAKYERSVYRKAEHFKQEFYNEAAPREEVSPETHLDADAARQEDERRTYGHTLYGGDPKKKP